MKASTTESALSGALAAGLAANAVLLYSFGSAWFRRGAPFVPTAQRKIDAIFGRGGLLAKLPRKALCVDLGSGGGALVRAATRQHGFERAEGYDLAPNDAHRRAADTGVAFPVAGM